MAFDIDHFSATDPTSDLVLSGVLRKLVRRGYGVSSVDEAPHRSETFDAGSDRQGERATRLWTVRVCGAPSSVAFSGELVVRETRISYGPADPPASPDRCWYELLPDSPETAKVLKANDGY